VVQNKKYTMGCCVNKKELIEIRFPKIYWTRTAVWKYTDTMRFTTTIIDNNIYSQYYKCVFNDIWSFEKIKLHYDVKEHMIYVYGDRKVSL
jgi:hypothetical protein